MSRRRWLRRFVQVLILAAVLVGLYRVLAADLRALSWTDLRTLGPDPVRLVLSLAALTGVYLMHAFLWRRIVNDLDVGTPDAGTTLRVYFVANLGRYIPGKFWQVAGLAVLSSRAGLSAGGATAAALLGQFGFLATGLLFVAVVLPDWVSGTALYGIGFILVGSAGAIWVLTATPAGARARAWLRGRSGERAGRGLATALDLAERMRGADAVKWGVGYGLSWVLLGFAFSLFATAFVPAASVHGKLLAGTVAASYLAGYAVLVAPAGLGVREGAMTALLTAVPGFSVAAAVVVAVLSRVWFTIGELLPLAIAPLLRATPSGPAPAAASPHREPRPAGNEDE